MKGRPVSPWARANAAKKIQTILGDAERDKKKVRQAAAEKISEIKRHAAEKIKKNEEKITELKAQRAAIEAGCGPPVLCAIHRHRHRERIT